MPQETDWWQLSSPVPHSWPLVQLPFEVQQALTVVSQTWPALQPTQVTVSPQLFCFWAPLQAPAHVVAIGSGVQHDVPEHS